VRLLCLGKKGVDYFSRRAFTLDAKHAGFFSGMTFGSVQEVVRFIMDGYRRGAYDRVEIIYNEFKTVARSRIVIEPFLPVPGDAAGEPGVKAHRTAGYIYEPSREAILADLLPRHLNFQLWRALLESRAAEEGARMAAMENATENANEMIEALQLQYNKARQALITKELLEIVGGAEALQQG
jgi:F-type H+-transporting ATPase subunit gamma